MMIIFPFGDRYDGQVIAFNNGFIPHGPGTMTFINGDVQTGFWYFGRANGLGFYQTSTGDYYRGEYRDGYPEGHGESYQARRQRRYRGEFRMGVESGEGVITKGDTVGGDFKRYEGQMWKGRRHGRGKVYIKQSDSEVASLEGMWADDVLNGPGRQISPTGQCFRGLFVNGLLQGEGTCKNADDGKTYEVVFTSGVVSTWKKEVK